MSSTRQSQANRRNARRSTGPRTKEGKTIVAANALTHGFSARSAVLPSESSQDFQQLLHRLEQEFQPQTAVEQTLVRHLADADWRLRRVAHFESAILLERIEGVQRHLEDYPKHLPEDAGLDEICLLGKALIDDAEGSDPLSKLSRYETRLTRRYFKALSQLRKSRGLRMPAPELAIQDRTEIAPWTPTGALDARTHSPQDLAPDGTQDKK
jgi:hypothetical protein